jgi:hypothetical protein
MSLPNQMPSTEPAKPEPELTRPVRKRWAACRLAILNEPELVRAIDAAVGAMSAGHQNADAFDCAAKARITAWMRANGFGELC